MKKILLTTLPVLAMSVMSTQAVIVNLPDVLDQSSTDGVAFDGIVTNDVADIVAEDSIYIAGTLTYDTINVSASSGYFQVQIGGTGNAYRVGHSFNTNDLDLIKPFSYELDGELISGTTHLVVIKMDTLTGAYSVWLDPNLGLTEASVAADETGTGAPTGTLENVVYKVGGDDVVDYTSFALYTVTDTPFALVPEPSSTALLGLGGLALILRRRK